MNRKGFTLVEILIVVIILGILAAIVIPQFTEASNDARKSSLASDLQTVRSQLELYKVQHLEAYPGPDAAGFVTQLTSKTDSDGTLNPAGKYGPYLQKFPKNPFTVDPNAADDVVFAPEACDYLGTTGWYFCTTTSSFTPNTKGHDEEDL